MTSTLHTIDRTEDNEPINIFTHYEIIPEAYEPNCESGVIPAHWNILKIWYGNERFADLEDFEIEHDDCAREIAGLLDDEL
jgi:hypothetical protein